MNRLYILSDAMFEVGASRLQHMADMVPDREVLYVPARSLSAAQIARAEIIFGAPPAALLSRAPFLQWLHLPSAGADAYADLSLYANPQIRVTTSSGVYGTPMAEHVLALFLALSRGNPSDAGRRAEPGEIRELTDAVVAVFGLGDAGRTLAGRLGAFGCTVLGVRYNILDKPACVHELFDTRSTLDVLRRADYVANCLPLTRETAGLFGEAAFAAMRPGAIFVNVGRGRTVDTEALTRALTSGHLGGAGLDVTDPEPLPAEHPLRVFPRVILTPHMAGVSPKTAERRLKLFEDLLARYLAGRRLLHQVDFFKGY